MLYHGTTHEFSKFSLSRCNVNNHIGVGVYLTDSLEDCHRHYTSEIGPDLNNRICYRQDEILSDDADLTSEEALEIARSELVGPVRRVLTCEIKPGAKLLPLGRHYLELRSYSDEDEMSLTERGIALERVLLDRDIEQGDYFCDCEISTAEILRILCINRDNDEWAGDIFRDFVLAAGYDGIEYDDARDWFSMVERGTRHFVLYKPELVDIVEIDELEV